MEQDEGEPEMRTLKATLYAGATLTLFAAVGHAQVPYPGFYAAGQGAYFYDSGPNDFAEFPGFPGGRTGDGFKLQGVFGYRFDMPLDIGIGAGYGWLSKGSGQGPFNNEIKANYWNIDGTIGYTFADAVAAFAVRPFIGVRYIDFSNKAEDNVAPIFSSDIDYRGVGPRVGADVGWRFADTPWFLSASISGAILFGKIKSDGTFPSGSHSRTAYNLDTQAGVGYEFSPGFAVVAGYQLDYWWNVNYRVESTTSGKGDRYAHGPFVRLAWNYGLPPQLATVSPPPSPIAPVAKYIVFFDWDRANITPQSADTIRQAADAYKAGRNARIEATGHADRSGSDQYNMGLSLRRANAVKAELVRNGVPAANIVVLGRGETMPLVQTADGVREPQNRRVEIVLQ
jgi:outer membrane protein OmpA-like peptidoglycan-associated protein